MTIYKPIGLEFLLQCARDLGTEVEDVGEGRLLMWNNKVFISFKRNHVWVVYVGKEEKRTRDWPDCDGDMADLHAEKMGFDLKNLEWIHRDHLVIPQYYFLDEHRWIMQKKQVTLKDAVWTRELALEWVISQLYTT